MNRDKKRQFESTFPLIGLSRQKSVTCTYGKNQDFFWPRVELTQKQFDELWTLCKGDWSAPKLAVIQFSEYGEGGFPMDAIMVGMEYK